MQIIFLSNNLELCEKSALPGVRERLFNNGTFDISNETFVGNIKNLTPSMDISFELKIENMDSLKVDGYVCALRIDEYFKFALRKSSKESKYYIDYWQYNGCGGYRCIRQSNPIHYSNTWQKGFFEITVFIILYLL